ncbi:cyclophilin-like fold protein [Streptomyces sp. NPDC091215]|uniref:cyclophilin-like fold protein n=1 Tax=Streptomyces sp. NPDC091215 TaxID=3155192 RepID=UPI0034197CC7
MPHPTAQGSTPITLTAGNTVIPAALNGTLTARRFKDELPFTITLQRYSDDYRATAAPLETDESQQQSGWKNGDIGYFGGWFTILFDGQEHSRNHTGVMIIGRVADGYLDTVRGLDGTITVTVALAS